MKSFNFTEELKNTKGFWDKTLEKLKGEFMAEESLNHKKETTKEMIGI